MLRNSFLEAARSTAGYRKLEGIENRWLSTYVLTAARALLASRGHPATETHEATRTRGSTP
jgi:hypothetical protein